MGFNSGFKGLILSDDASKLGSDYFLFVTGPFFLHSLNTPVQLHDLQDVKTKMNGYGE